MFHYAGGKVDWLAAGWPSEGTNATLPRVGTVARRDVPTCRVTDRVRDVSAMARARGWDQCVVVNEQGIVLGRLNSKALDEALDETADTTVDQVMDPGPVTYRPHEIAHAAAHQLSDRHVRSVLVTTADGELLGVFCAEDALAP